MIRNLANLFSLKEIYFFSTFRSFKAFLRIEFNEFLNTKTWFELFSWRFIPLLLLFSELTPKSMKFTFGQKDSFRMFWIFYVFLPPLPSSKSIEWHTFFIRLFSLIIERKIISSLCSPSTCAFIRLKFIQKIIALPKSLKW